MKKIAGDKRIDHSNRKSIKQSEIVEMLTENQVDDVANPDRNWIKIKQNQLEKKEEDGISAIGEEVRTSPTPTHMWRDRLRSKETTTTTHKLKRKKKKKKNLFYVRNIKKKKTKKKGELGLFCAIALWKGFPLYIPFTWCDFLFSLLHIWSLSQQHQNRSCNSFYCFHKSLSFWLFFFLKESKTINAHLYIINSTHDTNIINSTVSKDDKKREIRNMKTWPNTMEYD